MRRIDRRGLQCRHLCALELRNLRFGLRSERGTERGPGEVGAVGQGSQDRIAPPFAPRPSARLPACWPAGLPACRPTGMPACLERLLSGVSARRVEARSAKRASESAAGSVAKGLPPRQGGRRNVPEVGLQQGYGEAEQTMGDSSSSESVA